MNVVRSIMIDSSDMNWKDVPWSNFVSKIKQFNCLIHWSVEQNEESLRTSTTTTINWWDEIQDKTTKTRWRSPLCMRGWVRWSQWVNQKSSVHRWGVDVEDYGKDADDAVFTRNVIAIMGMSDQETKITIEARCLGVCDAAHQ